MHQFLFLLLNLVLVLLNLLLVLLHFLIPFLLESLYLNVEVLFSFHVLSELILAFELLSDECLEFLKSVCLNEDSWIKILLHNYSTFAINALLSLAAFIESFSRSGFSLKILHNFFVDSLRVAVILAIYNSTSSSSCLCTIPTRVVLLFTSSEYLY